MLLLFHVFLSFTRGLTKYKFGVFVERIFCYYFDPKAIFFCDMLNLNEINYMICVFTVGLMSLEKPC